MQHCWDGGILRRLCVCAELGAHQGDSLWQ